MENMRMPELKALARGHRLRGYSRLKKAELIALLQDNEYQVQRQQRPPPPNPQRHAVPAVCRCLLGNQIDLHRCLL